MTTRTSQKVGASNINPGTAVTTTAGTAVPAPGTVVPSPGTGTGTVHVPSPLELLALALDFHTKFTVMRVSLEALCRTLAPGDPRRSGATHAQREAATPLLIALQRRHTDLSSADPDRVDARYRAGMALREVATDMKSLLPAVEDESRLELSDAWTEADLVKVAAVQKAKTSPQMAAEYAPIRQAIARGKRVDTSAAATARAAQAAAKAQARAARAQQRAAAAVQSHTRTVQAHAANTTVRGTSPVPLANPQGPAASADVAPQGPAPGR